MSHRKRLRQLGNFWLEPGRNSRMYYVAWNDPVARQVRRKSLRTGDLSEADIRFARHVTEHAELRDQHPADVPLATVLVRYWERHGKATRSPEQEKIGLRYWSEFFGEATVGELTPDRIDAFIAHLEGRGYSGGYVSRILSPGRAALNRAYKRGEIQSVPFIPDVDRGPQRERRLITALETAALLDAIEDEHLLTFTMVALNTLARPCAVLELTTFQVDLANRLINFNPPGRRQTAKFRPVVPITASLLPWLAGLRPGPVVSYYGRPVRSIKTAWRRTRARAGLDPDVSPYTLRHTMATELRRRGVPAWEVAGMLGHRSGAYRTTEVYARYAPDFLSAAVRAIDAFSE